MVFIEDGVKPADATDVTLRIDSRADSRSPSPAAGSAMTAVRALSSLVLTPQASASSDHSLLKRRYRDRLFVGVPRSFVGYEL